MNGRYIFNIDTSCYILNRLSITVFNGHSQEQNRVPFTALRGPDAVPYLSTRLMVYSGADTERTDHFPIDEETETLSTLVCFLKLIIL